MEDLEKRKAFEEIERRARLTKEIILFSLLLALAVNLAANFLVRGMELFNIPWLSVAVDAIIVLLVGAFLIRKRFLSEEVSEMAGFQILLPMAVDSNLKKWEVPMCKDYYPTRILRHPASKIDSKRQTEFVENWKGAKTLSDEKENFGPGHVCRDLLLELVQASLVFFLNDFTKKITRPRAFHYGELRRLGHFPLKETPLEKKQWPVALKSNEPLNKWESDQIKIPSFVTLSVSGKAMSPEEKAGRSNLILDQGQCRLVLSISPYWSVVGKKEQRRMQNIFKPNSKLDVTYLKVPVELEITLNGIAGINEELKLYYTVFQKLANRARNSMNWSTFERSLRTCPLLSQDCSSREIADCIRKLQNELGTERKDG